MADQVLVDAANLAAIDTNTDVIARYLHAMGIRSHATVASFISDDSIVDELITKLKAGVRMGTNDYKLPDDIEETALKAQWLVLSRHCRKEYQSSFSSASPTSTTTTSTTPTTQLDRDVVPKSLPAGVYAKLVEDYNKITLDGVRRKFPEKQLLGAEKVLARMYHEHHTSKLYTATPLGEIMAQRVWTSFDTINSNRKKDPSEKKLILDDKNQISEKSQDDWDVRGQWMLIDATQALRWAWILLKYDSETAINKYVDWFQGLIRKNSYRIPNVKMLWEDFAWDIAMRMRSNETFHTITEDLMVDITKVNDILHQPLTKKQRVTKGADQTHIGKGRGYATKWSPPGKGRRFRTTSTTASSWQQWPTQPPQWTITSTNPWPTPPASWTTPSPTQISPTPAPTWTPSTPTPTVPFNPTPIHQTRPPWQQKGGDKGPKGKGKKGKLGKGGKK